MQGFPFPDQPFSTEAGFPVLSGLPPSESPFLWAPMATHTPSCLREQRAFPAPPLRALEVLRVCPRTLGVQRQPVKGSLLLSQRMTEQKIDYSSVPAPSQTFLFDWKLKKNNRREGVKNAPNLNSSTSGRGHLRGGWPLASGTDQLPTGSFSHKAPSFKPPPRASRKWADSFKTFPEVQSLLRLHHPRSSWVSCLATY